MTKKAVSGVFNWEIKEAQLKQGEMGEFEGQKLRFLIPVSLGAGRRRPLSRTFTASMSARRKASLDWPSRSWRTGATARSLRRGKSCESRRLDAQPLPWNASVPR